MKRKQVKTLFILLCSLICFVPLHAQNKTITGKIVDETKEPLVGVSVVLKGTHTAVITDENGKYSIAVPDSESAIVFSMIGFATQEVKVGNKTVINISFSENKDTALGDVVVIGYGSVKKKDLTGAVSSVSEKDFLQGVSSPDRLIIGKVAGVQVTPNGGAPGSGSRIRIRGSASLSANQDPLIIVDGIPLETKGVAGAPGFLTTINPNDIETMNILKDASATAIYGSRASNGVIIITTKKAKMGQKVRVTFDTRTTSSTTQKRQDVFSGDEIREIVKNHPRSTEEYRNMLGTHNTDWQDEIFRTAMSTDNNLSVAGSVKNLPYRVSLGYTNEEGILKTSNMERFTYGVNLNPTFFENHLKIDFSAKGSKINNRFAETGAIAGAVGFDPTQPVRAAGFDKYGGYFTWLDGQGNLNPQGITNPVLQLNNYRNLSKVQRIILGGQIDYKFHFLPELKANLNLGYDYADGKGNVYVPEWVPSMQARKGKDQDYGNRRENKLLEFYFNYNKEFEAIKSTIDITAGYTYQDWLENSKNYIEYNALGEEFSVPEFPFNKPRHTLISTFGRLNYSFMHKYLMTVSLRRDGSSRFHKDNRWGTFPSLALAWKIKEENFLKEVNAISDLKLRLGYGKTGQQDIGSNNYQYLAIYEYGTAKSQYQFGDQFYYMYRPKAYDKHIKWESTRTYNVALDYGFLDNKITGSIDFYLKKTDDLLNNINIPAGVNFSNTLLTNIGSLENKGFEFTINTNIIDTKDWGWNVGYNIAYNKNELTKLTLVDAPGYEGAPAGWSSSGIIQMHSVGYNLRTFYLYKQVYDQNGKPLEGVYADLNDDGIINNDDKYRAKGPEPTVTMGFNTDLRYRQWSLNLAMRANIGNYVYNNVNSSLARYANIFSQSKTIVNVPTSLNKHHFEGSQPYSDYFLENASFLKMDNISLTYDFGRVFKNTIGIRATAGVQNVFTITKYSGIDPEISGGIDRDFYPRPRVYSLGFNLNF